jgi:hypothetical protein
VREKAKAINFHHLSALIESLPPVKTIKEYLLQVCQPVMSDGSNCDDPKNFYRYIEEFTCGNLAVTERALKDMRMSFPSANSSFSFFAMTFCAVSICRMLFVINLLIMSCL